MAPLVHESPNFPRFSKVGIYLEGFSTTGFCLPEEIASGLFASATARCLKAADTLFQSGDTGDGCYLLNSGMLKVIVTSSQGDERILAILAAGAMVGYCAMIDGLAAVGLGYRPDRLRASLCQPN